MDSDPEIERIRPRNTSSAIIVLFSKHKINLGISSENVAKVVHLSRATIDKTVFNIEKIIPKMKLKF